MEENWGFGASWTFDGGSCRGFVSKVKKNGFRTLVEKEEGEGGEGFVIDENGSLPLLSSQDRKDRARNFVFRVKRGLLDDPEQKNSSTNTTKKRKKKDEK